MYRRNYDIFSRYKELFFKANYLTKLNLYCVQNSYVYMEISIDAENTGAFLFEIYEEQLPLTCKNFKELSTAEIGGYRNSTIHRIVADGWMQSGCWFLYFHWAIRCLVVYKVTAIKQASFNIIEYIIRLIS